MAVSQKKALTLTLLTSITPFSLAFTLPEKTTHRVFCGMLNPKSAFTQIVTSAELRDQLRLVPFGSAKNSAIVRATRKDASLALTFELDDKALGPNGGKIEGHFNFDLDQLGQYQPDRARKDSKIGTDRAAEFYQLVQNHLKQASLQTPYCNVQVQKAIAELRESKSAVFEKAQDPGAALKAKHARNEPLTERELLCAICTNSPEELKQRVSQVEKAHPQIFDPQSQPASGEKVE